jgi:uncharacterized protein YndB with AHSA1/START domain
MGVDMDHTVTVSRALPEVFAVLADPNRLSDWVVEVTDVRRDNPLDRPVTLEDAFRLRLGDTDATGEIIGHEPPWYIAFRLSGAHVSPVVRVSCTAREDGATQVHIHQADSAELTVDLPGLHRALLDLDLAS